MKKNKNNINYEVDTSKFKAHLKAHLLEALDEELVVQPSFFSRLAPKISLVAALLIVVVLGNQFLPQTQDAYAFLLNAKQKYEEKLSGATQSKTITEYTVGNTNYALNLWENFKNNSIKIQVQNKTTNQNVGEIIIKDKKLYSQKELKDEIKKGLKKDANNIAIADFLTKKLTIQELFFEDALAKKDLKFEGEIEKDNKKLVKITHADAEIYFDAETFSPIEFISIDDETDDEEEDFYPGEFKLLEQFYDDDLEDFNEEFFDPEDDWEEIYFDADDEFYPDEDLKGRIPYELEVYESFAGKELIEELEEELEKVESVKDIEDLEKLLNSLEQLDEKVSKEIEKYDHYDEHHKYEDEEDFEEMKDEIKGFFYYLKNKKGMDVDKYIQMVEAAQTPEELQKLEYQVPEEIVDLYEDSPFYEEERDGDDKHSENDYKQHPEDDKWNHYEEKDPIDHHNDKEDPEMIKEEIERFLEEAEKDGIDTSGAWKLLEKAETKEDFDALEGEIPQELKDFYDEKYKDERGEDYEMLKKHDPEFENDKWHKDDYEDGPDEMHYDDFEEGPEPGSDEYGEKVNEILDSLKDLDLEGVDTEAYYKDLQDARSHEDLNDIMDKINDFE